jgi:hypothetical protein
VTKAFSKVGANQRIIWSSVVLFALICSCGSALTGSGGAGANKKVSRPANTLTRDFELVEQTNLPAPPSDANCLMLNPQFQWQITHQSEPKDFMKFPDTMDQDVCNDPTFDNCSGLTQKLKPDNVSRDLCVMCRLHKLMPNGSRGHVNWFPATYTGKVCFNNFNFPDMDYTFSLQPDGDNGLTRWNPPAVPDPGKKGIPEKKCSKDGTIIECSPKAHHIEFDSRETVERFRSSEWSKFRSDASPCLIELKSCHPDQARADVSLKRAVVIGLFGLDTEHNIYSELHPVYAIAIEMNSSPDDNTWMIFARNMGDEGACSLKFHPLYGPAETAGVNILKSLKLLIPPPEGRRATGASYDARTEFYSNNETCPTAAFYNELFQPTAAGYRQNNQGVLLNFDLKACGDDCAPLVEGTLHITWDLVPLSDFETANLLQLEKQKAPDQCVSLKELDEKESREFEKPTKEQKRKLNDLLLRARAESLMMRSADCPYNGRIQSAPPQAACSQLLKENRESEGSLVGVLPLPPGSTKGPYQDIIRILGKK